MIILIMKNLWIIILIVLAAVAVLIYFNKSNSNVKTIQQPTNTVVGQNGNTVVISNFSFVPSMITIKKGEPVIWINQDQTIHSIKIKDQIVSQQMGIGESFSDVFNQTGEIDYGCGIHPSMKGKIIVQE